MGLRDNQIRQTDEREERMSLRCGPKVAAG